MPPHEHWRCGDCGATYPKTVAYCTRSFDDYLSLRGGSIESAISRAVEKAISPLVARALRRLEPPRWSQLTARPLWVRVENLVPTSYTEIPVDLTNPTDVPDQRWHKRYADDDAVLRIAESIAANNADLMERLE